MTDIVASTEHAAELGDSAWRELVQEHHAVVRSALRRNGGRELDTAGDGFFAVFEKFAGIAGPALFAASVTLFTSSRAAVLSIIVFFVVGALVLTRVDVAAGEAQARYDQEGPPTNALTDAEPSRNAS